MTAPQPDFLDRPALADLQRRRLRAMLAEVLPRNPFYARKLDRAGLTPADLDSPDGFRRLPFTTKAELVADQQTHPPYGTILTYPIERYRRLHQTSGTTAGQPLRWLDTPESWDWMIECWRTKIRFMKLRPDDRLFFPFSFGPFLGFWTAFEAAARLGYFCLPGGGMSSSARLRFLLDNGATVVLATPTYALRLAEVARTEGIDLSRSPVRILIVAGEPGGSIPATRGRIEEAWGARVFDHYGMTEIGPLGIECDENPAGLHLLETECLVEVIDPDSGEPVGPGQTGEMVLTNLGRWGSPVLRYRTGDLVRIDPRPCPCGRSLLRLEGGILGRTDDMIHFRGNNVYPAALEGVIRRFAEVAEYRIEVDQSGSLPVLRIELEPVSEARADSLVAQVDQAIRDEFLFRAEVRAVPPGTLPRFEMKARRITRKD
ncbi:MAG TPA: AMP-binding protein [Gemmataceae bacterium]|nr:AMP-binding protein [Gemmataceae bacterium]